MAAQSEKINENTVHIIGINKSLIYVEMKEKIEEKHDLILEGKKQCEEYECVLMKLLENKEIVKTLENAMSIHGGIAQDPPNTPPSMRSIK